MEKPQQLSLKFSITPGQQFINTVDHVARDAAKSDGPHKCSAAFIVEFKKAVIAPMAEPLHPRQSVVDSSSQG
ncbi:MAG: hypothetical protein OSB46_14275 [Alphaproteobacteria bacterium]|nr:hypothetical protein [Alphaproteobacteria bacterium]